MSIYIGLKSACGATTASVDIYDLDLNPDGVVCCGNCRLIIETRNNWRAIYEPVSAI